MRRQCKLPWSWLGCTDVHAAIHQRRINADDFDREPLAEFNVNSTQDWYWFGDFHTYAKQEKVTHIYIDEETKGLYYLTNVSPTNDSAVAIIFYYNKLS